jgi:hypothetical protein
MNLGIVSFAVMAAASLPGGCGQLFTADVQVNDVCKTLENQQFPAAPAEASTLPQITAGFTVPVGEILNQVDFATNSSLKLKSISVAPTQGISDLTGIEEATVRVSNGGQEVTLASYQRASGVSAVPAITFDTHDFDIVPFLSGDAVTVTADLAGSLPAVPWTATVTACFTAAAHLELPQ